MGLIQDLQRIQKMSNSEKQELILKMRKQKMEKEIDYSKRNYYLNWIILFEGLVIMCGNMVSAYYVGTLLQWW